MNSSSSYHYIVFSNTLFPLTATFLQHVSQITLLEHPAQFTAYRYSKTRLCYMISTMSEYRNYLLQHHSFPASRIQHVSVSDYTPEFWKGKNTLLLFFDPLDPLIAEDYSSSSIKVLDNPNFFLPPSVHRDWFRQYGKIRFTAFYTLVRHRFSFSMPSTDPQNRKPFPRSALPQLPDRITHPIRRNARMTSVKSAVHRIQKKNGPFYDNPGSCTPPLLLFPLTTTAYKAYFLRFLENYADQFSPYQDAMIRPDLHLSGSILLYHSGISVGLNNGLLPLSFVLEKIKPYKESNPRFYENFWRQHQFREYQLYVFLNKNAIATRPLYFHKNTRPCPSSVYTATTGIRILDDHLRNAWLYGYQHHIVRLMLFGVYFLQTLIHPDAFFQFCMEWQLDAYPWVMKANVYSMCYSQPSASSSPHQFGFTKPYIHGSAYLRRMSLGYKEEDMGDWDEHFQNFIQLYRPELQAFGRLFSLISR